MSSDVTQREFSATERAAAARLATQLDGARLAGVEANAAAIVARLARTPKGRAALRKQLRQRGLSP